MDGFLFGYYLQEEFVDSNSLAGLARPAGL